MFIYIVLLILLLLVILRRYLKEAYSNSSKVVLTSGPNFGNKSPLMLSERPLDLNKPQTEKVERVGRVEEAEPIEETESVEKVEEVEEVEEAVEEAEEVSNQPVITDKDRELFKAFNRNPRYHLASLPKPLTPEQWQRLIIIAKKRFDEGKYIKMFTGHGYTNLDQMHQQLDKLKGYDYSDLNTMLVPSLTGIAHHNGFGSVLAKEFLWALAKKEKDYAVSILGVVKKKGGVYRSHFIKWLPITPSQSPHPFGPESKNTQHKLYKPLVKDQNLDKAVTILNNTSPEDKIWSFF